MQKSPIRSYVCRKGRITKAQKQAIETLWPLYGLDSQGSLLDFDLIFNNKQHPIVLEIGFGMGESLLDMAKNHSEKNFIGIDVHAPGIGALLKGIEKEKLTNIRIFAADAIEILCNRIPTHSLNTIQLFFPDPWPKKKHHKRRLIQSSFIELIQTKLYPGGLLHIVTDWEHYALDILSTLAQHPCFKQLDSNMQTYPATKFQKRAEALHYPIWNLLFTYQKEPIL